MKTTITSIALLSLALVTATVNAQGYGSLIPQRTYTTPAAGCKVQPRTYSPQPKPVYQPKPTYRPRPTYKPVYQPQPTYKPQPKPYKPMQAGGGQVPTGTDIFPVSFPQSQPTGGTSQPTSLPQPQRLPVSVLVGTWFETLNNVELKHDILPNGFHRITNLTNGGVQGHKAKFDGRVLTLLNGRYLVTVAGRDLRLSNTVETRTWSKNRIGTAFPSSRPNTGTRPNAPSNGGTTQPTVSNGLPRLLQGTWFEASPDQTIWRYDLRATSYDMFDLDPATGNVNVFNGEPIQVINGPLTSRNMNLHLSPGADAEEGPFNMTASPDGSQLFLTPVNGGPVRRLTRTQPRI